MGISNPICAHFKRDSCAIENSINIDSAVVRQANFCCETPADVCRRQNIYVNVILSQLTLLLEHMLESFCEKHKRHARNKFDREVSSNNAPVVSSSYSV